MAASESPVFTPAKSVTVHDKIIQLSSAQLAKEPNSVLSTEGNLHLDVLPSIFTLILAYLSGYQITSIVPVDGLSMTDTLAAARRDGERLGLKGFVDIVDAQLARKGRRNSAKAPGEAATNGNSGAVAELSHGVYIRRVAHGISYPQMREALQHFLLQSLRLSFLRHLQDPLGPSLVRFDDTAGLPRSGHVIAAGLDDPDIWPELNEGAAEEEVTDVLATDYARGATGLRHSETIGAASGAGMRVGGRKRTWFGRREREKTIQPDVKGKGRESDEHGDTPRAAPKKREAIVRIVQRQDSNVLDDSPFDDSAPSSDTDAPYVAPAPIVASPSEGALDTTDGDEHSQRTPDAAESYTRQSRPLPQSFAQDRELSDALRGGTKSSVTRAMEREAALDSSEASASGASLQPQTHTTDNEMYSMLDSPSLPGPSSTSDGGRQLQKSPEAVDGDLEEDGLVLQKPAAGPVPVILPSRRERRRVNISARTAVAPQQMPAISEDGNLQPPRSPSRTRSKSEARRGPVEALILSNSRTRSGSLDTTNAANVLAEQRKALNRKLSAPNLPALDTSDPRVRSRPTTPISPVAPPTRSDSYSAREAYPKTQLAPSHSQPSALTARLKASASSTGSTNPYTHLYGALKATDGLEIVVFFPESKDPLDSLRFTLRRDCTVEETIGSGLREYFEAGREPRLDADLEDWNGDSLVGMLDPARWNLMLAEADGEIDYDFPLSRDQKIRTVGSEAYGIIRADDDQYEANAEYQAGIVRRPSRIIAKATRDRLQISTSSTMPDDASSLISSPLSASAAGDSGPQVLLRVRIPMVDSGPVTSTIKVLTQMYLADVLDRICRRRKEAHLSNPKEWVLMMADRDFVVPLDRTVESLQGVDQLRLAKRRDVADLLVASGRELQNNNPSAPIFKRLSEPAQPKYVTAADVSSSAYVEWRVYRKSAMSLTRHERILSIDGDYVNVRSAESGRMGSFHISSVVEAKQSKRVPTSFKLTVWLDNREMKRQDYETATTRDATEIVTRIKALSASYRASQAR